jgi:hypothetical protein
MWWVLKLTPGEWIPTEVDLVGVHSKNIYWVWLKKYDEAVRKLGEKQVFWFNSKRDFNRYDDMMIFWSDV